MWPITRRRTCCMPWFCARRMRMRAFASARSARRARCRALLSCSPARIQPSLAICPARARSRNAMIDVPPYPILVQDEVRHVGDAIAFVVADTIEHAKDAAEAIALEWEPLPHVIGAAAALRERCAAGVAAMRTESRVRDDARRCASDGGGFCAGGAYGHADGRQSAARHQLSRHPRRHRRIRRQHATGSR